MVLCVCWCHPLSGIGCFQWDNISSALLLYCETCQCLICENTRQGQLFRRSSVYFMFVWLVKIVRLIIDNRYFNIFLSVICFLELILGPLFEYYLCDFCLNFWIIVNVFNDTGAFCCSSNRTFITAHDCIFLINILFAVNFQTLHFSV